MTVANRAFLVVAACTWNDSPADITSAESAFNQRVKTHMFPKSFLDISQIFN